MQPMKMLKRTLLYGVIVGASLAVTSVIAAEVDTIYLNGDIITMNDALGTVEAVAVAKGKIVAVGKAADIKALAVDKTRTVDLQGRAMLPGFIDSHGHFFYTAEYAFGWVDLNSAPIGGVETIDDMIALLQKKAAETPEGEWILGWGYDDTNVKDMRHPTREDLDKVSSTHPIYIQHISGWLSSANSLGLEKAGINKDTPDPEGGAIRKNPETGEPTGVIESAQPPVYEVVPKYTEEDYIQAMAAGSDMYLAAGVTTAQEGWGDMNQWKVLQEALKAGTLKVRTIFWPVAQGNAAKDLKEYPNVASGSAIDDNRMLVFGANKLTADGSIQGYTGFLSNPYHKQREGEIGYRGYPTHKHDKLVEMVVAMHKEDRQIAIHGNGDAAIDFALDAFEAAQEAYPKADARHIVIHSQMARDDQIERMKRLEVIPSFFVTHTYFWGDRHHDIFMGPDRAARMSPVGSAVRNGLRFTLHNDTYITPISPLMATWSAVNRQSSSGRDLGKDLQGVSVYEALKGVTIYAAWQGFEEKIKGSIEVDKLADFVVLDENPLETDPMKIKDIKVRATILSDNLVYGDI